MQAVGARPSGSLPKGALKSSSNTLSAMSMLRLATQADTSAVAACVSGWMPMRARLVSSAMASLGLPCRPRSLMRRVTSARALFTVSLPSDDA